MGNTGVIPALFCHHSLALEGHRQRQPAPYKTAQPMNYSSNWPQQPLHSHSPIYSYILMPYKKNLTTLRSVCCEDTQDTNCLERPHGKAPRCQPLERRVPVLPRPTQLTAKCSWMSGPSRCPVKQKNHHTECSQPMKLWEITHFCFKVLNLGVTCYKKIW